MPELAAGDLGAATSLRIHVSQSIVPLDELPAVPTADGGRQRRVAFELPGWSMVLAQADPRGAADFGAVIEAIPRDAPVDRAAVEQLRDNLF